MSDDAQVDYTRPRPTVRRTGGPEPRIVKDPAGVIRTEIVTDSEGNDYVQFVTATAGRYRIRVGRVW